MPLTNSLPSLLLDRWPSQPLPFGGDWVLRTIPQPVHQSGFLVLLWAQVHQALAQSTSDSWAIQGLLTSGFWFGRLFCDLTCCLVKFGSQIRGCPLKACTWHSPQSDMVPPFPGSQSLLSLTPAPLYIVPGTCDLKLLNNLWNDAFVYVLIFYLCIPKARCMRPGGVGVLPSQDPIERPSQPTGSARGVTEWGPRWQMRSGSLWISDDILQTSMSQMVCPVVRWLLPVQTASLLSRRRSFKSL